MPTIPAPVHTDDEVRAYFCEVVLPTKEVWVVEKGQAVVALLVLEDEWIDQLHVDPDFVADGLGSSLIAVAKAERPGGSELRTFADARLSDWAAS